MPNDALDRLEDGDTVVAVFDPALEDQEIGPVRRAEGAIRLIVGHTYLACRNIRNGLGMPHMLRIDEHPDPDITLIEAALTRKARLHDEARGVPVFTQMPRTAQDFEAQLTSLAEMIEIEADWAGLRSRKDQLVRQFDDTADTIALATRKRTYLRARARVGMDFNPWTWPDDRVMRIETVRPLPADFEPDPRRRKDRQRRLEEAVRIFGEAEREIRELAARLRRAGCEVRRPHPNAAELRVRITMTPTMRADITVSASANGLWRASPTPPQNVKEGRLTRRMLREGHLERLTAHIGSSGS